MGLSTPKTPTTPIPEQAQFDTQIDNVAGTKVERVKQPDGIYALVRSKLPLSEEDQLYQDTLKGIAQSSLDFMTKLTTDYDRSQIPWLDDYLKDYEATQNDVISKAGVARTNAEEKALARYGQADSTAAVQARDARGASTQRERTQLGRDMSAIEQDARNSELSKQGGLYSLATGGLNTIANNQIQSISNLANTGLTQQANTQSYNNAVSSTIAANNAAKTAASQAGLSNLSGLISLGAPAIGSGGSSLFSGLSKSGMTGGWANYGGGTSINWASGRAG